MSESGKRPIIVRKKKAESHGSHGAWKIAYADFMTAMMAFFLVMWLLSGLDEEQMEDVSEYFRTPLSVALAGGDRRSASDSAIPGGGDDPMHSKGEVALTRLNARNYDPAASSLESLQQGLQTMLEQDPELEALSSQLSFEEVEDGLLIQIIDDDERPMFALSSARLAPYIDRLLRKIAPKIDALPNQITLTGHTDDLRFADGDRRYSNWELSADRANAARRALVDGGMAADKLLRVVGAAATSSRPDTPGGAPANRRISILVLNSPARERIENNGRLHPRDRAPQRSNPLRPQIATQDEAGRPVVPLDGPPASS